MSKPHGNARIPVEQVAAALRFMDDGRTLDQAAVQFGISYTYLQVLRRNRRRRLDAQRLRAA